MVRGPGSEELEENAESAVKELSPARWLVKRATNCCHSAHKGTNEGITGKSVFFNSHLRQ